MSRRLLAVHAHPDDETITCGATMAAYAADGAQVTLVTCTLGEEGEILLPALAGIGPDGADQLGGYRIVELERACAALGVTDHRFLGGAGRFRDSGMMGTPANAHPRAFWGTDPAVPVRLLAAIVDEIRPQVVLTYDTTGGYGHPDHIRTHQVSMAAVDEARWQVPRVLWTAAPWSVVTAELTAVREDPEGFDVADTNSLGTLVDDSRLAARVDGPTTAKRAAMRAHATQLEVSPSGRLYALSNHRGRLLSGVEHFTLGRGAHPGGVVDDVFAGLV